MKRKIMRLLAMLLILVLLLTGCDMQVFSDLFEDLYSTIQVGLTTHFEDMTYVRPDPDGFQTKLDHCMAEAETATDADALMTLVFELYELYYDFITNYQLANIHYYRDMTDIYWDEEYSFCLEASTDVSAGMDNLLYALADCPLREELEAEQYFGADFFDAYEGDSLWDETFTALMAEENALLDQYYSLNARQVTDSYYSEGYFKNYCYPMEEVFVELVKVRQQIAEYAGYDSYPAFAYEFYYYRDYTPEQTAEYIEGIRRELVGLYLDLDPSVWNAMYENCTEEQMMAYLTKNVEALGGTAKHAYELMTTAGVYDITYSENKYDASFEVYLPSYSTPFLFVNPTKSARDKLTLVHEFGHFCSDYASPGGSQVGIDVAEIFSQSLEYLSLANEKPYSKLRMLKLADSLSVYVEQAAYARFELDVYELEGDDLTVEKVRQVYRQVLADFGLLAYGRDQRDYVLIPHFFISAEYVISYVVSNDVSMQIYCKELETPGAGVQIWQDTLATTQQGILGYVEEAGLESPFAEGQIEKIAEFFTIQLP